jgi:hypothetical protein
VPIIELLREVHLDFGDIWRQNGSTWPQSDGEQLFPSQFLLNRTTQLAALLGFKVFGFG